MNAERAIELLSGSGRPDREALVRLLSADDAEEEKRLFSAAREAKERHLGLKVHLRGLIEFSNICASDCLYCGIRMSRAIARYTMSEDEILACARLALESRCGSVVLQSGERSDAQFTEFVDRAVRRIKRESQGKLGITLSCGEQSPETYGRWFESGAHRYLLRIESSDRALFGKLHPAEQDFDRRVDCLKTLKELGYQVGTGVMIGLPGQSVENLADDLLFFVGMDMDMIGMGPYVVHKETPLGGAALNSAEEKSRRLKLALRMTAVTRLAMKDVNIAAPTALQALDPWGREKGLLAGANIVMPNLTPRERRGDYLLYEDKPCTDDEARRCIQCLERRINSTGHSVGWEEWGDSRRFLQRGRPA